MATETIAARLNPRGTMKRLIAYESSLAGCAARATLQTFYLRAGFPAVPGLDRRWRRPSARDGHFPTPGRSPGDAPALTERRERMLLGLVVVEHPDQLRHREQIVQALPQGAQPD